MADEGQILPYLPNIPEDIIFEILLRLPVKSLSRFKCVCKSWLSVISSSKFIKTHLRMSNITNGYAFHKLLLSTIQVPPWVYNCSLYSVVKEHPSVSVSQLEFPIKDLFWVVGSCNGLICICKLPGHSLMFCNFSTKKYKTLPSSETAINLPSNFYMTHAFGYDEANDDYKVVQIYASHSYAAAYVIQLKVYSLRTNSWKTIKDLPSEFSISDARAFVSGALHWRVYEGSGTNKSPVIFSMNVETETYGTIAVPFDQHGDDFDWSLEVLEGSLCVLCKYGNTGMDLWIMKVYGVFESWTKVASIRYNNDLRFHIKPLFVSEKGEILMKYGPKFVVYNAKNGKFEYPGIHIGSRFESTAVVYTESLVSPDFENS